MYSGFITSKRAIAAVGVHQRFDTVAYRIVESYFAASTFPSLAQIIHFEGVNGPDGLKVKSPGKNETSHLYNPLTDTGPVPEYIEQHYKGLVAALKQHDMVRAAFEAAWMAHYICDGMTPAHHFPLDEHLEKHELVKTPKGRYRLRQPGEPARATVKKSWAVWGGKGLLTTHFNFEMGVAAALIGQRIRVRLDVAKLVEARQMGITEFFKQEARDIAELQMYERFYDKGWNTELARQVKVKLAPQTVQLIAIAWLLAYLETGQEVLEKDLQQAKEQEVEL